MKISVDSSMIYNRKEKRYITFKTAKAQGLLRNPQDFTLPENSMIVKTGRGYELKTNKLGNKWRENTTDFDKLNPHLVVNPITNQVVKSTLQNRRKIKKDIKQSVKDVPTQLGYLRDELSKRRGQSVVFIYMKNGVIDLQEIMNIPIQNFSEYWNNKRILIEPRLYPTTQDDKVKILIYDLNKVKAPTNRIIQYFKDGVSNCVLTPIKNWIVELKENSKSSATKAKYNKKLKQVEKMLIDYHETGVAEDKLQFLANDLNINIEVCLPFNSTPYIVANSEKPSQKTFKYINSKCGHLDHTFYDEPIQLTDEDFNDLIKNTDLNDEGVWIQKTSRGLITKLMTTNYVYTRESDLNVKMNENLKQYGLNECYICDVNDKELTQNIRSGTRYNSTVDFTDDLPNVDDVEHIDMIKAYSQFYTSKYYKGLLGKITDCRRTNTLQGVGLYRVNLNINGLHTKLRQLNDVMHIWENGMVSLWSAELDFLQEHGAKYTIHEGIWGIDTIDFRFTDDMLHTKTEDKLSYYALMTGMLDNHKTTDTYTSRTTNFETAVMLSQNAGEGISVLIGDREIKDKQAYHECNVIVPKKSHGHIGHFTGQITTFTRLNMLEQLLRMDINKLVRVCVDGIYYYDHDYELLPIFTKKDKKTLNNLPNTSYICPTTEWITMADYREHNKVEVHNGAGGCGKTHHNLTDKGLIKVLFTAPTHKLCYTKRQEYGIRTMTQARLLLKDPDNINAISRMYNVMIHDEVSMMSNETKQLILATYPRIKHIFCGDIKHQLPAIEGTPFNTNGMVVIEHTKNYRCQDRKLAEVLKLIRKLIDENKTGTEIALIVLNSKHFRNKVITEEQMDYTINDLILTPTNKDMDYITKKFKGKFAPYEKYKINETKGDLQNGCIVIDTQKPTHQHEVRHAFTVHSVQGETANHKLFIQIDTQFQPQLLYTAISRARTLDQIVLWRRSDNMFSEIFNDK